MSSSARSRQPWRPRLVSRGKAKIRPLLCKPTWKSSNTLAGASVDRRIGHRIAPLLSSCPIFASLPKHRADNFDSVCGPQDSNGGKYVSPYLVHNRWFDRRVCCQIRHAHAPDTSLDDSAWDCRFNCGRMCNSHVFAPEARCSVSSSRYHFLHTWSPSRFVCLVQTEAASSQGIGRLILSKASRIRATSLLVVTFT